MQHAIQLDLPGIAPTQLELALPEPSVATQTARGKAERPQDTARRN